MLPLAVTALLLAASPIDTTPRVAPRAPEPAPTAAPVVIPLSIVVDSTHPDTVHRKRPRAIEYSDWYARRLTLHRWASYTMLPLFAAEYAAGSQLMAKGRDAPRWAIKSHGPMATGVATLFTINTVTGLWNLWDSRSDPAGRGPRIAHSLLMLAGDAGFTAAGMLATPAQNSGSIRQLHKNIALGSMGASLLGYLIMLPPFRRN